MSESNASDMNARMTSRRRMLADTAMAIGGLTLAFAPEIAKSEEAISHSEEAIRQQVIFKAARQRVFTALTNEREFDQVTRLSAAMRGGMPPAAKPTKITATVGGEFFLFGGHITGRQIELVADERIVQAWRPANWDAGIYSIARFELMEQGAETKLVFEHTGFPKGQAEHLAAGWIENYWEPLAKFLTK